MDAGDDQLQLNDASISQTTWDAEVASQSIGNNTITSPSTMSIPSTSDTADEGKLERLDIDGNSYPASPASPVLPPDYDDIDEQELEATSLSPISSTVPDRLRQLAATAWVMERNEGIEAEKLLQINQVLKQLGGLLEDDEMKDQNTEAGGQRIGDISDFDETIKTDDEEEEEYLIEQDLYRVHDYLASTVQEMRLRTQEQKHLHSLTTSKLETVVQRCLAQEHQVASLSHSLSDQKSYLKDTEIERDGLRQENRILGTENDTLRMQHGEMQAHIKALEAEVQRQAVALVAMNSAVTGLEQWIEHRDDNGLGSSLTMTGDDHTPPPREFHSSQHKSSNRFNNGQARSMSNSHGGARTVVRGRGRFRGRYQVDVDDDGDIYGNGVSPSLDGGYSSPHFSPRYHENTTPRDYFPSGEQRHMAPKHQANSQISDLQDDVRAWIRGCRDVLECAQAGASALEPLQVSVAPREANLSNDGHAMPVYAADSTMPDDDEWGDFQGVQTAA